MTFPCNITWDYASLCIITRHYAIFRNFDFLHFLPFLMTFTFNLHDTSQKGLIWLFHAILPEITHHYASLLNFENFWLFVEGESLAKPWRPNFYFWHKSITHGMNIHYPKNHLPSCPMRRAVMIFLWKSVPKKGVKNGKLSF